MPRVTYRTRLDDLLAKDYLSPRDREFAESLLAHYNRKKYMSSGRARWVRTLEDRYAEAPTVDSAVLDDLRALSERIASVDASSWDAGFVDSVMQQVKAGRAVSEKQQATIDKVKSRWDDNAMAAASSFAEDFKASDAMRDRFAIMAAYYKRNGYYSSITSKVTDDFVPTKKQYDCLTGNKYAAKILAGWEGEAKYPAGSMAMLRGARRGMAADASRAIRAAAGKPVVVLTVNASAPVSACKGNKIYKVLPVGCAETFLVEERDLKTHRIAKKKVKKSA